MDTASESVGGTKGNNGCKMSVCKRGSQEMAAAPVDSVNQRYRTWSVQNY